MAHRMCMACRIRSQTSGDADELSDDLCPGCGMPLQAVDGLASIMGFRSVSSLDYAADAGGIAARAGLPGPVQDIRSRRGPLVDLVAFDAEFDDYGGGDGASTAAVSMPWPDLSR